RVVSNLSPALLLVSSAAASRADSIACNALSIRSPTYFLHAARREALVASDSVLFIAYLILQNRYPCAFVTIKKAGWSMLCAAKPVDMPEVGYKCLAHRPMLQVCHPKFFAGGLDQFVDCRIMHVADARKQVVLHLEIESAEQPGNRLATGSEIGRGT